MRKVDLAWAAGFLDGEGSFVWQKTRPYIYFRIVTSQTHAEVLKKLHRILGGNISGPYRVKTPPGHRYKKPRKPIFFWALNGEKAEKAFKELLPFLSIVKRKQGRTSLEKIRRTRCQS